MHKEIKLFFVEFEKGNAQNIFLRDIEIRTLKNRTV